MPIKKPEQFHVPGARNHTSLARRISVELGRHLGRRSLAHTFTRYVANAVKRRILKAGPVKGPIGAVLATALLAEAFLAWGAAMDTLRDPIIDVSQFVE